MAGLVIYRGAEPASVQLEGEGTLSVAPGLAYNVSLANAAKLIASNPRMWEAGNAETKAFVPGVPPTKSLFYVTDYGARGDGVTDDTAAIQAAINAAQAAGGATIFFPLGTYSVSGLTLTFAGNEAPVNFEGAGRLITQIVQRTGSAGAILTIKNSSPGAGLEWNGSVKRMTLFGEVSKAQPGLVLENVAWAEMEQLEILRCSVGLEVKGGVTLDIHDCFIKQNTKGIVLTQNVAGTLGAPFMRLAACVVSSNSTYGIEADYCPGLKLDFLDCEVNGEAGKLTTGGIKIGPNVFKEPPGFGAGFIEFTGCWLEENKGRSVVVESGDLRITDSIIFATDLATKTTNGRDLLVSGTVGRLSIRGCSFPTPAPESRSSVEITAAGCIGAIDDTPISKLVKTAAAGVIVRAGSRWQGPLNLCKAEGDVGATIAFNPTELGDLEITGTPTGVAIESALRYLTEKEAGEVFNSSLFVKTSNKKLCWKDSAGGLHELA